MAHARYGRSVASRRPAKPPFSASIFKERHGTASVYRVWRSHLRGRCERLSASVATWFGFRPVGDAFPRCQGRFWHRLHWAGALPGLILPYGERSLVSNRGHRVGNAAGHSRSFGRVWLPFFGLRRPKLRGPSDPYDRTNRHNNRLFARFQPRITLDAVHQVRDFPLPRLVSPVILA
jgi:hypothetical protein